MRLCSVKRCRIHCYLHWIREKRMIEKSSFMMHRIRVLAVNCKGFYNFATFQKPCFFQHFSWKTLQITANLWFAAPAQSLLWAPLPMETQLFQCFSQVYPAKKRAKARISQPKDAKHETKMKNGTWQTEIISEFPTLRQSVSFVQ